MAIPLIDSHVHLWPQAHLPTIAWHSDNNPLGAQYSVDEYHSATNHSSSVSTLSSSSPRSVSSSTYLRGFIYLEVDRVSSADEAGEHGWRHVLDEVSYVTRIATGNPVIGEGHSASQRELLLAFVPWAPIPQGPAALERYMSLVRERTLADEVWLKVRGVRYLVQDKPLGTMLTQEFVDSLKWLGRQKLAFDLGVDARQGGLEQLRQAVTMMRRVYDGVGEKEQVVIIISKFSSPTLSSLRESMLSKCNADHLCKPNLHIRPEDTVQGHPQFSEWKRLITTMAAEPATYMKLSGLFSELPSTLADAQIGDLVDHMLPWLDVVFDTFKPHRIMFGSDWPVCNLGGGGDGSWAKWKAVVECILDRRRLTDGQRVDIWGGTAVRAYGLDLAGHD
ncbi:hypothetical protein PISL3812_06866 [Talaromyces islandicus]|uniref:Amidohydrolase-related domain-containing protein n=1 Tax=Talaromyces islandicus TaxID=28573 RepID=A0A0U1M2N9_TALIS|nr:hypothetical protein PISL3812_06866 [Talaromyces islandicus]